MRPNFGGSVDVHGGLGRDSITATAASGTVDGGLGDDDITLTNFVNPAVSAAYGGLGDDTITADQATDMGLIDGGFGDDRISTGPLAVVAQMTGGFGDDRIVSQHGTSTISGGFGRDFIDGGDEGDTIDCGCGHRPLRQVRGRHRQQLRDRADLILAGPAGYGRAAAKSAMAATTASGLLEVRAVPAGHHEPAHRTAHARLDAIEVREARVLVLGALDEQRRRRDPGGVGLEAPVAHGGIEPDVAPAVEGGVGVVVVAGQARAQLAAPRTPGA